MSAHQPGQRAEGATTTTVPIINDQDMTHPNSTSETSDEESDEIEELERRLAAARARRRSRRRRSTGDGSDEEMMDGEGGGGRVSYGGISKRMKGQRKKKHEGIVGSPYQTQPSAPHQQQHFLLLLSDSALPLGSFAFSSGLESYLSHSKHGLVPPYHPSTTTTSTNAFSPPAAFTKFLPLSLASYAATSLPYLLAAHHDPRDLVRLDDAFDATMLCAVGRRASIAQGRALLSLWERSLSPSSSASSQQADPIRALASLLRQPPPPNSAEDDLPPPAHAHLPPLFGAVASLTGLSAQQAAYVFLLSHVKALVGAAVRAGVCGPFWAQGVLAGGWVRGMLEGVVGRYFGEGKGAGQGWDVVREAGQTVPVVDLWVGRHEVLYSRIFNS